MGLADLPTPALCPTVNLHDRLYAVRGDEVVDMWPVEARGYLAA